MAQGDRIVGFAWRNRRRDRRRPLACRILAGAQRRPLTTKDLSLGGFAAVPPLPELACGAVIPVTVELADGRRLDAEARIVRNGGERADFAAAFVNLGTQTFAWLERLMLTPAMPAEAATAQ